MTDPTDFICGLMRQNTDALGFITKHTLEDRFIPAGWYVIQRNRFRKPIGYLLHGPVHPDGKLHIHQACIDLDKRNRGFGAQTVATLVDRAIAHRAKQIVLRCAADLEAVTFWTHCGFLPTHLTQGGLRRQRSIVHFTFDLQTTRSPTADSGAIVAPPSARPHGRS